MELRGARPCDDAGFRLVLHPVLRLILREHPLDFGGIARAGQREHQQHARLDRREILSGNPAADVLWGRPGIAATASTAARRDPSGARARRRDDEHAFLRRVVDAFLLGSARRSRTGARDDDPFRAGVGGGLDQIAVGSLVDEQHIDPRQFRHRHDVEFAAGGVTLQRRAVEGDAIRVHHAEDAVAAGLERVQAKRVGLGDLSRRVDLVVEHDQRAFAACIGGRGDPETLEEVGRAFVPERARVAHRSDHDHGPVAAHREVEEVGELLERVGPAGDDEPGDRGVRPEDLVQPSGERDPLIQRQLAARQVRELLELRPGVALDSRHRLHQLFGGQPSAVPVGDGAARRDQPHARDILRLRRQRRQQRDQEERLVNSHV